MGESEEASKKDKASQAGKEAWQKGKEKAKLARENIHRSLSDDSNEKFYSAFSYLPIIGPVIVWLFKRHQALSALHLVNAAYLQIAFMGLWLAIWLMENIPVVSSLLKVIMFSPYITNAIMYVGVLVFIGISAYAGLQGNQGKRYTTPFLFDFANKYLKFYKGSATGGGAAAAAAPGNE